MRRVGSNTGPLLHLAEAQALTLLSQIGEVSIPKAVDLEMAGQDSLWRIQNPTWIDVHSLSVAYEMEAVAWQQVRFLDSEDGNP